MSQRRVRLPDAADLNFRVTSRRTMPSLDVTGGGDSSEVAACEPLWLMPRLANSGHLFDHWMLLTGWTSMRFYYL